MSTDKPIITIEIYEGDGYSLGGDAITLADELGGNVNLSSERFAQLIRDGLIEVVRRVEVPVSARELIEDPVTFARLAETTADLMARAVEDRALRQRVLVEEGSLTRLRPGTKVEIQTSHTRYEGIVSEADTDGIEVTVPSRRAQLFVPWPTLVAHLKDVRPSMSGSGNVVFVGLYSLEPDYAPDASQFVSTNSPEGSSR